MAVIAIHDLQLAGQGFFTDSESFMDELSGVDVELSAVAGGFTLLSLIPLYGIAIGTQLYMM
jgi:hypothetical protein